MWKRFSLWFSAKMNKLMNKIEDPGETLDYSYQKQLESLQKVKKGIADVVTAKKRMQMQATKLEQQKTKLDEQARAALGAGNEALARTALERKAVIVQELAGLDTQIKDLEMQQEQLIANEQKLKTKIEGFRTKKEVIKAQYSAAEAQVRISELATGVGDEFAAIGQAVQRMEEKTEDMRSRAGAMQELEEAGVFDDALSMGGTDTIDRQLAELTAAQDVESDLAALKAELGVAPAPALDAPTPAAEPEGQAGA